MLKNASQQLTCYFNAFEYLNLQLIIKQNQIIVLLKHKIQEVIGSNINRMNNSLSLDFDPDELKNIKERISNQKKIEEGLAKFVYLENQSYEKNIEYLTELIEKTLLLSPDLSFKFVSAFKIYLSIQRNIPIEINFKSLKYQQLMNLYDEWQNSLKQHSAIIYSERLYTTKHRNILFNRVFVEQKNNITDYFQTLSENKMLKPVDVYQLLVDILSHYHLYEFASDNQTFFEKINSFNIFLEIVEKFKHSEKRIIIDNKTPDFDYIKIYEFEALINYWESINPQLQLRSEVRFSICNVEVQTEAIFQTKDRQNDKKLTLDLLLNKIIKDMNKLTEDENSPQKLEIIQNICEAVRIEKIKLCQLQKNKHLQIKARPDINRIYSNSRLLHRKSIEERQNSESQKTEKIQMRNTRKLDENKQKLRRKKQEQQGFTYLQNFEQNYESQQYQNYLEFKKKNQQKSRKKDNNMKIYSSPIKILYQRREQKNKQTENYPEIQVVQSEVHDEKQTNYGLLLLLQQIFQHYSDLSTTALNVDGLNKFFVDIGITQKGSKSLIFRLIKKNLIKDANKIKIVNFLQIIQEIQKQDKELTNEVIEEFIQLYIRLNSRKNLIKTPQFSQNFNKQYIFNKQPNFSKEPKINNSQYNESISRQKSSQKKSRRYKYSQEQSNFQAANMFKARERGKFPSFQGSKYGLQRFKKV